MSERPATLALVGLLAALAALSTPAAAVQRVEIGEQLFAFDLPEEWEAIPQRSLREHMADFQWGFQRESRRRFGDLPLILIQYQPIQMTPDLPRQWQDAMGAGTTYDATRQLLLASAPLEGGGWRNAIVQKAVFFGRNGAAIFTFVSSQRDVERYQVDFDRVVDSFAFHRGHEWPAHLGWRLAAAGALVAGLAALGIYLQRRLAGNAG